MSISAKSRAYIYGSVAFGAISLATTGAFAACSFTPPLTTQTKCLTAVQIPGAPLRSYDISWVNPDRAEYYLADRSNAGIDIIDTKTLTFKRRITGFIGEVITSPPAVNNDVSGPDGVVTHGRWLYAGDGNSTLKVIDLNDLITPIKQSINTGGTTRVDEMALTTDGKVLIAANNAEDPPFATLFRANGDAGTSSTSIISRITIDPTIVPPAKGLAIEQPAWDPKTKRFYTSLPRIAGNPTGCNPALTTGPLACDGGLLVTDPLQVTPGTYVQTAYNPVTNVGVIKLHACGPNGATVGPHDNLLLGCTPANNGNDVTTLVINATTHNYANIGNITGSDEVWFNSGDARYYTASNRNCTTPGGPCPTASTQTAVLGVIDATSVLIETIPQSSGSHSVAADSKRNLIFVPQSRPRIVAGDGGDTTAVGAAICGSSNGCVAVYKHDVDEDDEGHDHDGGDHDH
jgi:hypothetical protein